jgi:hypothetical protein
LECFRKPKACRECGAPTKGGGARGLCKLHYGRWQQANLNRVPCAKCGKSLRKRFDLPKGVPQICMACFRPPIVCKICGEKQYALKLCRKHYKSMYG